MAATSDLAQAMLFTGIAFYVFLSAPPSTTSARTKAKRSPGRKKPSEINSFFTGTNEPSTDDEELKVALGGEADAAGDAASVATGKEEGRSVTHVVTPTKYNFDVKDSATTTCVSPEAVTNLVRFASAPTVFDIEPRSKNERTRRSRRLATRRRGEI